MDEILVDGVVRLPFQSLLNLAEQAELEKLFAPDRLALLCGGGKESLARGVEVCAQSSTGIEGTRGFSRWLVKAA